MNSIPAEQPTYRGILARMDSIEAHRAAGLEESITSLSRQRYISNSLHRDDNILGSLVAHGYVDKDDTAKGKDEVDVSYRETGRVSHRALYACHFVRIIWTLNL